MKGRDPDANTAQRQPAAAPSMQESVQAHRGVATAQHSTLQAAIDRSPRMLAQRRALQAAFGGTFQRRADGLEDRAPMMGEPSESNQRSAASPGVTAAPVNATGMPNQLKAGIESLSGTDMSDVRVHRNSDKPAQLNALAYARGNDIHLGPGQEQQLPHEAWHVVQQRQGRVKETVRMAGVGVNDEVGLEREADLMGGRAARLMAAFEPGGQGKTKNAAKADPGDAVVQGLFGLEKESRVGMTGAKDGIVAEGSGLRVVPDNGAMGKIYEFVTVPFDEHSGPESTAIEQVTGQLGKIWSMMNQILALKDTQTVNPVFEAHGLSVRQTTRRRTGPDSSLVGPVHFTVGLKLGEWQQQSDALMKLSKGGPAKASEQARMQHAGASVELWKVIDSLTRATFEPKIAGELAGYFSLAYLTIAAWQANLSRHRIEQLNKQIPLAFLKVPPSAALAGINQTAKQAPGMVAKWVQTNSATIVKEVEARLPRRSEGGSTLGKLYRWLLGENDGALNIIDEQVTIIPEKEALGSASAVPYGYAAELRNIAVADTSSMALVLDAAIKTIQVSRGPGEHISQKDRDYGRKDE